MDKTKTLTAKVLNKATTPLLWRVVVFLLACIIYSGLIGPRIISGGILYRDHFGYFGGLGKSSLFGMISFFIFVKRSNKKMRFGSWSWFNTFWLLLSLLSFVLAWLSVRRLLSADNSIYFVVMAQGLLWLSIISLAGGVFGPRNIRKLISTYKNELMYSFLLSLLFYVLLILVYGLWKFLAELVLHSVRWLLSLTGLSAEVQPPRTLLLSKFDIEIAQTCSGIESIALFSGLYILVGVLDWRRFNHKLFFLIFPFALVVLFGFNILRIYSLILAGYYINPQIAFSLFHTYAGMVFFIIYSALFWGISYKWMLSKNELTSSS